MIVRRLPDGWAAWPLLVTTGASLAAAGHRLWTALGGAADGFISITPAPVGRDLLGIRWYVLWSDPSLELLLLTALLPLLVLSGARVGGRPTSLVPNGRGRSVGVLLAAVTAAVGVAGVVGFLAQLAGVLPVTTWSGVSSSQLDAFAPSACAVLVTAVLGAVATAVLAHRAEEPLGGDGAEEGESVADEPRATEVPAAVVRVPAGPPVLRPEDAARYRRP
ncbi:hypothetical protein ACFEMC_21590 [Kineococcus sp. DHX-1]|uniref:hypothetical protein n=1 Tax=Kineococcus sp. DHX-1 TaxID=3349638 RepID=UPI0036D3663C